MPIVIFQPVLVYYHPADVFPNGLFPLLIPRSEKMDLNHLAEFVVRRSFAFDL